MMSVVISETLTQIRDRQRDWPEAYRAPQTQRLITTAMRALCDLLAHLDAPDAATKTRHRQHALALLTFFQGKADTRPVTPLVGRRI